MWDRRMQKTKASLFGNGLNTFFIFYILCITPVDIYVRDDANIEDGTMIFSPKVGEGDGSVVSSVTDKYGFLAGDVLQLEVSSTG